MLWDINNFAKPVNFLCFSVKRENNFTSQQLNITLERYPDTQFPYFSMKTYVVGTEALLMCTHNICFHREVRKISILLIEKSALLIHLVDFLPFL